MNSQPVEVTTISRSFNYVSTSSTIEQASPLALFENSILELDSLRVQFLNCPVDRIDTDHTLEWIAKAIKNKTPRMITVVNANKLWLMSKNQTLRETILTADLIIPEYAVVWGAKRLGLPPLSQVLGISLAQQFLPFAEQRGFRPYFLGASQEVVEGLVKRVKQDYPRIEIAGYHNGYLTNLEIESEVITEIKRSKPDFLFVAMGSPKQELWIKKHLRELEVPVCLGVGGTFDVMAGFKKDTPAWARGKGLEWLYRTAQNPRSYLKRYLITNSWFMLQLGSAWLNVR